MILKTASWFSVLPPDHIRIGISRGVPRLAIGKGYRLYRKLAPGPWFNHVPLDEYRRRYDAEILAPLDPQQVVDDLLRIAGGRIPVLCCFERPGPGQWCHRAIVSEWFHRELGIHVSELGHESETLHPLRPPEMLIP